jgi:MFS family permease
VGVVGFEASSGIGKLVSEAPSSSDDALLGPFSPGSNDEVDKSWFTPGIGSVGAASFFSDSGHEIATALLPTFFTSVLHGTAAGLGTIEGVSDALMGVAKLIGGPPANDPEKRRRLAVSGYLGTAVATGAIGLAGTVWQAGALRAVAWISRGARSPSRDALLGQLAPPHAYGRAYGVERAGDNLGAVAGPLLAALLVTRIGIRPAIWCAAIPGALAAVAILIAAREAKKLPRPERQSHTARFKELRGHGVVRAFIPIVFFECGNTAVTLLILRATQLLHSGGRSLIAATSLAIVIYAAHNAAAACTSLVGGHWIDRSGPRVVFAVGAGLYVVAYSGFAVGSHSWLVLLGAFVFAGAGIGLSETSESTVIAHALPDTMRGSGFGALGGVQAVGDIVSSVTVGILYVVVSPLVAFLYAATWMTLSLASTSLLTTTHRSGAATGASS